MSNSYDLYLQMHKENVRRGFEWIQEHLPELIPNDGNDYAWQICFNHDASKTEPDEYDAYDAYFYGGNRSHKVVKEFNSAWLQHIHRNPHHWQHWVLFQDEGPIISIEMPYIYILEMICDWWSFSWNSGDLKEIFKWWEEHEFGKIELHPKTKLTVINILEKIKNKLEELENAE